jgi:3-hydroxyisobutyrate dehydrogenase
MKVGFIGLGAMGRPMARHLLAKGHELTVASRSPGPVKAAIAEGARAASDVAAVGRDCAVTIICVPGSADVEAVVSELAGGVGAGQVVVDCSTIDPDVERAQHARVGQTGAGYIEAPMSGGTAGAEAGTLTLMVGGGTGDLDLARPALEAFAARIVHVGGPGQGQVVKLGNNLIYAAQMVATAEATTMAAKAGIDLSLMHEVLVASTGDCTAVRTRIPFEGVLPDSPASNDWQPGFMTDLMAKDIDLALAYAARSGVPALSAGVARQVLTSASVAGYGREDFSALGKVIRHLAGT